MSFSVPSKMSVSQASNPVALELNKCIAKTCRDEKGSEILGRTVSSHCHIVGCIARGLLERLLPGVRKLFPDGSELIAAIHDVGKISPTFQKKIRRRIADAFNDDPNWNAINPDLEKNWDGHAGVSELTVKAYLKGDKYTQKILGQHHGWSPSIGGLLASDPCFGGASWQLRREELIRELEDKFQCKLPKVTCPSQARILAGLTTISDWIGSGSLFDDPNNERWFSSVGESLDRAGFISPMIVSGLSFNDVFGCSPRTAQKQFIESCQGPGIYVLEAPMGIGKTEAALYAAYQMLALGHANGIYFALPTQLTSEKIYERMERFLDKILDSSSRQSAQLIHGNSWLRSEMGEEGLPGGSWFSSTKRAILAPFGVGTIDQALMAVMNVKHGFVRMFGLIGKVVILDEVHSYDSYTGTILDDLVENLSKLGCTVIILSATLTLQRRKAFLKKASQNQRYPLISFANEKEIAEVAIEPDIDSKTNIRLCQEDREAMEEVLRRAEEGQQVLWIENTVAEAQQVFLQLNARSGELNVECGLLHSRFLRCDREKIEEKWVAYFGKEGAEKRKKQGRILVGTQVLEQSLDIDADFLITRICPTDMILQRIGRLWRHTETIRPPSALREAWILSPSLDEASKNPKQTIGTSTSVYSCYVLLRSIEIWEKVNVLLLPSNMRDLIEKTYESREEKGIWKKFKNELEKRKEELKRFAQNGLSEGGKALPECKASTRYEEMKSVEVLLVQKFVYEERGLRLKFLDETEVFLPKLANSNLQTRRHLSATVAQNMLKVPKYEAPETTSLNELEGLKGYVYIDEQEEARLCISKVLPSERLISLCGAESVSSRILWYNSTLGYKVDN